MPTYKLIILMLLSSRLAFASQPKVWHHGDPWPACLHPRTLQVSIKANVVMDGVNFVYAYSIFNSSMSDMPVVYFTVDLGDNPTSLSEKDMTTMDQTHAHFKALNNAPRVHPVKKICPSGWEYNSSPGQPLFDIGLWPAGKNAVIKAGYTVTGFGFRASEPPGIRSCLVQGNSDDCMFYLQLQEPVEFSYMNSPQFLQESSYLESIAATVAPVHPPDPFTVGAWTARMLSDASEARKLGWIASDQQLARINSLISSLNTDTKRKLKKAMNEIERYVLAEKKAGHLTEEADALVRLNALYLLRRAEKDPKVLK